MPSYPALAAELKLPAYADMSDQAAVNALNADTISVIGSISITALGQWAAPAVRGHIEDHAANPSSPVRSICLSLRDYLTGLSGRPLDLSDPNNVALMGALQAAGVLSSGDAAALLALATTQTSRAAQVFGVAVSTLDVHTARGL